MPRRLEIVERQIAELAPNPRNARTHSAKQISQIAASIGTFGWTNPILTDDNDMIVAGHGRVAAAEQLGLTVVPTCRLSGMTKAQIRAYAIADNKLAERAGWDFSILTEEFAELNSLELDFDLTITGFETAEIDNLLDPPDGKSDPLDDVPPLPGVAVSEIGDLWRVGRHALLCGNALEEACYATLLEGEKAQFVFTDAPYNVAVDGHVSGLGRIKHREFAMATVEMSKAAFIDFLTTSLRLMAAHSVDGAILHACMDWRHIADLIAAGEASSLDLKNICVWVKSNAGMGSLYRSRHEFVAIFKSGTAPHINTIELGKHGRYRTNVWEYAGFNSFGPGRDEALAAHPTCKPVALVMDAIKDSSRRGGLVLDPFVGSGTTLLAAHKTGRRGAGIELDPLYVDLAIDRLAKLVGQEPVLAQTRESFADVAARRAEGRAFVPRLTYRGEA